MGGVKYCSISTWFIFLRVAGNIQCWLWSLTCAFFREVIEDPTFVTTSDVFDFISSQPRARKGDVARIATGELGLAASTIKRRFSRSGLVTYLVAHGSVEVNPVSRRLKLRRIGRA
jgi:hypothetical protein